MSRDFPRSRRIEDQVLRILGEVLRANVRDPRLQGAIITAVDVSRDLSVAGVYYSSLEGSSATAEIEEALESASGYLRGQLAKQLTVRQVPELRFRHDDSLERGAEMDRLIDEAVAGDKRDVSDDGD
jgi:ribosome-binding factor A